MKSPHHSIHVGLNQADKLDKIIDALQYEKDKSNKPYLILPEKSYEYLIDQLELISTNLTDVFSDLSGLNEQTPLATKMMSVMAEKYKELQDKYHQSIQINEAVYE